MRTIMVCVLLALIELVCAQLKGWAEKSGNIQTFLDTNTSSTVSTSWERVTDEELAQHTDELKSKAQQEGEIPELFNAAWKIQVWSDGVNGSNYFGWFMLGADTNVYSIQRWGNPVVYSARVASTGSVLVVYGNAVESWCEVRKRAVEGREMQCLWRTNWLCKSSARPELAKLERSLLKIFDEGKIVRFTHEGDATTISACWETISMEEMGRHAERLAAKRGKPLRTGNPYINDITWKFYFWSSGPTGSNYLGWMWHSTTTNQSQLDYFPPSFVYPEIFDAMLMSNTLLVVFGDTTEVSCEARGPDPKGMNLSKDHVPLCRFYYWRYLRELPKIERAFLKAESVTNVVAYLVSEAGVTNRVVWQPTTGWHKVTPVLNPTTGERWSGIFPF